MSKPAPLSRITKASTPSWRVASKRIAGCSTRPVNFQARVALDLQMRGDVHPDFPLRVLLAEFFANHLGEQGEIDRAALQLLAADP